MNQSGISAVRDAWLLRLGVLCRVMQIKAEHLSESYGEVCTQGEGGLTDRACN